MMLAAVDPQTTPDTPTPVAGADARPVVLASWAARAGALGVDILPGAAVAVTTALVALTVSLHSAWWWVCVSVGVAAIVLTVGNRVLGVFDGRSFGRAVFGITIAHRDGAPLSSWWLLLRDLAHLVDTAPVLAGWLWPLWDARRRTCADVLARTESRRVAPHSPQRTLRRLTAALLLAAALLCAAGAAISYTVVHQHDQMVAAASAQIAAQGPHMVEQLLSYHPETIQGDFDRARSVATDKYRAELSAQQQAVQKAGPVRNEYWVTSSSVLTAAPHHATMLLFLQGERGAPPNHRYITASVRATFVELNTGRWRVDDLAVVTKPQPAEATP